MTAESKAKVEKKARRDERSVIHRAPSCRTTVGDFPHLLSFVIKEKMNEMARLGWNLSLEFFTDSTLDKIDFRFVYKKHFQLCSTYELNLFDIKENSESG